MIKELESVLLTMDMPEYKLRAGDMGTVVHSHEGKGYLVEFVTFDGRTIGVLNLKPEQVRKPDGPLIGHARTV